MGVKGCRRTRWQCWENGLEILEFGTFSDSDTHRVVVLGYAMRLSCDILRLFLVPYASGDVAERLSCGIRSFPFWGLHQSMMFGRLGLELW